MLRSKSCILAGSSGTHSVCVCTIHQNVILLLHAAQTEETYEDLIGMAVCSLKNKDGMLQRCVQCPGFQTVRSHLLQKYKDTDEQISFKQWSQLIEQNSLLKP